MSGKGEWLPTHDVKYDEEDETPAEDRVPKNLQNNFYLGDLLELVIDLQHPAKEEVKKTDIPNWLPLKLSLLGYAFSGKKTLAELVQQKYNLELISVEDLINECIEIAQV